MSLFKPPQKKSNNYSSGGLEQGGTVAVVFMGQKLPAHYIITQRL